MGLKSLDVFSIFVVMMSLWQPTLSSCPSPCHCTTHFYVYCQSIGLEDSDLPDLVTSISRDILLLDLSGNKIQQIPTGIFEKFQDLEYLSLSTNKLKSLSDDIFRGLTNLGELILHRNTIANISSGSFKGLTNLRELHIGNNQLELLYSQTFSDLSRLTKLHLQKNNLSTLEPDAFIGLSNIHTVNISHNSLTSLQGFSFRGLFSLINLDLSNNNLSNFSHHALKGLDNIQSLYLERNNISSLVFLKGNDFYSSLTSLTLSHNNIDSIPPNSFTNYENIRVLDLSSNCIRRIGGQSFQHMTLETLYLQHNNITSITREMFDRAYRITNLDLSHNKVTYIKTGAFDSIREKMLTLDLAFNKLTFIHPGMFRGMRRLRFLSFGSNFVDRLEPKSFGDLVGLSELDISANQFQILDAESIRGPLRLRKLRLVCNPLRSLVGFRFDDNTDDVTIETNSTMIESFEHSAVVTWPFTSTSHHYWTVTTACLTPRLCKGAPIHKSNLEPYKTELTLRDLNPSCEYFVCVNPVFLSTEVKIYQCVHVRTQEVSVTSPPLRGSRSSSKSERDVKFSKGYSSFFGKGSNIFIVILGIWTFLIVTLS